MSANFYIPETKPRTRVVTRVRKGMKLRRKQGGTCIVTGYTAQKIQVNWGGVRPGEIQVRHLGNYQESL